MVSVRCYLCVIEEKKNLFGDPVDFDYEYGHVCIYEGNGMFKCPNCGTVYDHSTQTYILQVSRTKIKTKIIFIRQIAPLVNRKITDEEIIESVFNEAESLLVGEYYCDVFATYWFTDDGAFVKTGIEKVSFFDE